MVTMLVSNVQVATVSYAAAVKLHSGMLSSIFRAPMEFFHTNLLGRILNRFSKDQQDVDRSLSFATGTFLRGVSHNPTPPPFTFPPLVKNIFQNTVRYTPF